MKFHVNLSVVTKGEVTAHLQPYRHTYYGNLVKVKVKQSLLHAWSGPEGSRKLGFPDFMTKAQDGGKVVSLTHQPPLPQEMLLVLIFVRGWVNPRAMVRSEGFHVNGKF